MKYSHFTPIVLSIVIISVAAALLVSLRKDEPAISPLHPLAPSFLYLAADSEHGTGTVNLFEIPTHIAHHVRDFSFSPLGASPMAQLGFDDTVLLALGAQEQYRLAISTQTMESFQEFSLNFPAVRSPRGTYLAFNRAAGNSDDQTELVIRSENGGEKSLESGSAGDIGVGMLEPLHWSPDEKVLYAHRIHATEGAIVGLYAIDIETMGVRRVTEVDDLGISGFVFDGQDNVYGFQELYRVGADDEAQHALYRISLTTGVVTSYTLEFGIDGLFAADATGRFLAYADGDDAADRDLWIFDLMTGEQHPVTENAVVHQALPWNETKIVFLEESVRPLGSANIVSYDVETGVRQVLVDDGQYFALIGWYPSV